MRIAVFSTKPHDREFLSDANRNFDHELVFFEPHLDRKTTPLAAGFPAVCLFVNDFADRNVLNDLADHGTRLILLRCAGFNQVDLAAAAELGLTILRVPAYSPHAVAEHTVGLMLALNRKLYRAYNRVREGNFALDGLLGFDMHGRTVGIIGTGNIGAVVARIVSGFGCRVLAVDKVPKPECEALGVTYVTPDCLFSRADIITLHCPLLPETRHLINEQTIAGMKDGVMLINTSRGAVLDTRAVIRALKTGKIGYLGLDVYEEETDLFFEDLSDRIIQDDVFARLLTFPNVLITSHAGFFTRDALNSIAITTLHNAMEFEKGIPFTNEVNAERHLR
ncbi:MAG: 2-hydroxyacid dehydrogenase [Mariprofundaceae bacterium]|nr:2-hydroxyacid dehydrogenase [Mariprofundaceae bacterium]